ncbi:hypothetical protein EZV62_017215 [Acer yangbiense]|uniref:COBRA C-terminal domain-containing protein n=1 Tax=Acer yangbiense TaxID=1000413 RepID=A0A5C7HHQ6_9ROSI|nr:hypothetical protein EZV62_017215 [Acer yangbiense]
MKKHLLCCNKSMVRMRNHHKQSSVRSMCLIRVHWHVKQSYKEYWRVKITVTNLNVMRNYSQRNTVVLHPNLQSVTQVFSFNYKPLNQYDGYINIEGTNLQGLANLEELQSSGKAITMEWPDQVPEHLFGSFKGLELSNHESTVWPLDFIQRFGTNMETRLKNTPEFSESRNSRKTATETMARPEHMQGQQSGEAAHQLISIGTIPITILALDLESGKIRWYDQLGGYISYMMYGLVHVTIFPPLAAHLDLTRLQIFGEAPMMLSIQVKGIKKDIVVAVQKSGFAWALHCDNGTLVWETVSCFEHR